MPRPVQAVSELRGEELRVFTTARWWRAAMLLGPPALGALAAALLSANPFAVFALATVGAAVAGAIATFLVADSRAKRAFVPAWASSRGWTADAAGWREEATPLLRDGDRRDAQNHVSGPLADGSRAVLCHYTFEVKHTSRDSQGHTRTTWEEHRFTVVQTPVAAPGIPRLTLHPRSFGDISLFDRIDSALTSNRVVALESSELGREYKLEVGDDASEPAVRLLFEPTFIVWCLDQAADELMLEIENDTLVVAVPDHSYDAAELDDLVAKAATVAARVADSRAAAEAVS